MKEKFKDFIKTGEIKDPAFYIRLLTISALNALQSEDVKSRRLDIKRNVNLLKEAKNLYSYFTECFAEAVSQHNRICLRCGWDEGCVSATFSFKDLLKEMKNLFERNEKSF